jgi:pimeloyl-ACP methyl ester carboxylesterase
MRRTNLFCAIGAARPALLLTILLLAPLALSACGSSDSTPANTAAWSEPCPRDTPELRRVDVGEVELNVACQGSGPTVVLLHGFPEFWRGWSKVMAELAGKYRLIAPDQRGYDLSDKPEGVEAYAIDRLIADVVGLIDHVSSEPVVLVGHDWGGSVAWPTASLHPDRVRGLVIANAPHPNVFAQLLATDPAQQQASGYVSLFVSPQAESVLAANDYAILASIFTGLLDEEELAHYRAAWSQPGALTGGLNWYRASFTSPSPTVLQDLFVDVPTLVLWGLRDVALVPANVHRLHEYVSDLRVELFPDATHWIEHEKSEEVARSIDEFASSLP